MGDFNARMGYCKSDDDVWCGALSHHGLQLDVRNRAGKDLIFGFVVKSISYHINYEYMVLEEEITLWYIGVLLYKMW